MADSPLDSAASRSGTSVHRRTRSAHLVVLAAWGSLLFIPAAAQGQRSCEEWAVEISAVEGSVQVQRGAGPAGWQDAVRGDRLCTGDGLRTLGASRATLSLPDETTLRLGEDATMILREPTSENGSLIEIVRGLIHVISRTPRLLNFTTPYANAGLEGTEFDIGVNETQLQTEVAVLEGRVKLTTPAEEIGVDSGHLAIARAGESPRTISLAAPIEIMRWSSYYPPIVTGLLPPVDRDPTEEQLRSADFFARRAAAQLETARIAEAERDLSAALEIESRNPTALSLQGIMALARADFETARERIDGALAANADAVVALIAKSHVEQADDELAAAQRAIDRAFALEPDNWIVLTRRAELSFARGDALSSLEDAARAQQLAPNAAAPVAVIGFAHLAARDESAARAAFEQAVALEPEAPLPHIGLALAAAQRGDLVEARRQLEVAVASDPANALTRSYMAKIYETEYRGELTATQLDLAKSLDPYDPTPWLYSALSQLRSNRVVEALHDLRAARQRSDDRAVFRSRLLLDEDLATRSAAIGRVHTELGFDRLGFLDGWQAVVDTPQNYAGHRLLSDLYAAEPRHEVARISELLSSQLLQPINMTPVKPQLAQPALFLSQRVGPSRTSFDEFTSPVASNGLKLAASSVTGDHGVVGTEVAVAGLTDRVAFGGGYYRFDTDGFRPNQDLEQRVSNAFAQFQPSYRLNLQAELRSVRTENGYLPMLFDESRYSTSLRSTENANSLRLGAKRQFSATDIGLASVIVQDSEAVSAGSGLDVSSDRDGLSVDLQYLKQLPATQLQTGVFFARQDDAREATLNFPGVPAITETELAEQRQLSVYGYAHLNLLPELTLTVGAAADRVEGASVSEEGLYPRLGVMWRPTSQTIVRAAAFRTLVGSLTTSPQNPQPRLEPMQVAGFTQMLSAGDADIAEVRGLGVDHALSEQVFVGWAASLRATDRPFVTVSGGQQTVGRIALNERVQQAYLYWTPNSRFSFSATAEKGRYANDPSVLFSRMHIERLPLELRYFSPRGLTLGLSANAVHQAGWFEGDAPGPFEPPTLVFGEDRFWTLDSFVSYRLPKRRGSLSLNADNLLDERFRFQDIDPSNPSFFPERLISFRFTLAFN